MQPHLIRFVLTLHSFSLRAKCFLLFWCILVRSHRFTCLSFHVIHRVTHRIRHFLARNFFLYSQANCLCSTKFEFKFKLKHFACNILASFHYVACTMDTAKYVWNSSRKAAIMSFTVYLHPSSLAVLRILKWKD